jgi:hypothetical protein
MKLTIPFIRAFASSMLIFIGSAAWTVAATFVVTNANDSGPGSLRDALTQANSNGQADTINFDPGLFAMARTIVLASELQITMDGANPGRLVTINGPGADRLTISGNNAVRAIYAADFSSLSISGITIRDGNGVGTVPANVGTSGGAILCNGCSLTLTNMVIRNNTVPNEGGGIFAVGARALSVIDSLITENNANYGGGIWHLGAEATVMRNTTISNNVAKNSVGGALLDRGTITMENCVVTGNKAATFAGVAGGAGSVGGLSFFQTNGTVTDTVVSNNTAGFDLSGNAVTAGFYAGINADGGAMTFRRVTVTGNRVSADPAKGVGVVGGMHLRVPGTPVTIIDSLISGNEGGNEAGGIATSHTGPVFVINTTIANNKARRGGGIRNHSDDLTVINSTITGNTAAPWTEEESTGGGGIMNLGSVRTRVQNSIIANNNAEDLRGGFISNGYNIIGNTARSTGFGATGDQLDVNPLLDPNGLQNNGGPTLTIALQPNSPAIDKGRTIANVSTDQRGVTRPTDNPSIANASGGDASDIGAYEIGGSNGVAEKTLGNIATRLPVQTGENVLIGGIIVVGDVPKRVIIRALGPSLGAQGVGGALEDPVLELYEADTLLAANDNWREAQQEEIAGTGVAPGDDRESAIVRTLPPGNYTAILRGKADTTGVGLLEAYDLDQRPNSKLANISTRGFVGSGDQVLIGGFIVGPTTRVVVRAIGPSLGNAGVAGALQDPTLQLVNSNGEVVRANDNWKGTQRAELEAIGIQPADDRESALIATLTAGNYTAVVGGAGANTGVGLVEVYNLP